MDKEIDKAELDKLCQERLGTSLENLLTFVTQLGAIQRQLEGPLYLKRFDGLLRSTEKEDPYDCSYVRLCVIDWLKQPEVFQQLVEALKIVIEGL